jgi:hypothetical protein
MAAASGGREFWHAHVEAWRESGLTQRAYCRAHELPEVQLSHWKQRLQKARRCRESKTQLVPVHVIEASAARSDRPRAEKPRGEDRRSDLTLVLDNGWRLEIGEGFKPATLSRVLEALRHVG